VPGFATVRPAGEGRAVQGGPGRKERESIQDRVQRAARSLDGKGAAGLVPLAIGSRPNPSDKAEPGLGESGCAVILILASALHVLAGPARPAVSLAGPSPSVA
jgi:hypothetical protein